MHHILSIKIRLLLQLLLYSFISIQDCLVSQQMAIFTSHVGYYCLSNSSLSSSYSFSCHCLSRSVATSSPSSLALTFSGSPCASHLVPQNQSSTPTPALLLHFDPGLSRKSANGYLHFTRWILLPFQLLSK